MGEIYVIYISVPSNGKAKIQRRRLTDLAKQDVCRVNNLDKAAKRRNLNVRRVEDILNTAKEKLDHSYDFHLFNKNCEYFLTKCRY